MVDIHSHILPGWDDGSPSMEVSLEMLQIAAESGTTDIVATPHANTEFPFQPDVVRKLWTELRAKAGKLINIHLGSDFHVQFENVQDALTRPGKYTINGGPYLMVELPEIFNAAVMRDVMQRLRDAGVITVITHPERNMQLQNNVAELRAWVAEGALMQITGQSLSGRFGAQAQQCCNQLLRENLVHFVASDAHDPQDRTPRLTEAYEVVASRYGKQRADLLFETNPGATLTGAPIEMCAAEESSRKWWAFWR